jgi:hypothetical protein
LAWDHHNLVSPILPLRTVTGETITDPRQGGTIENMVLTQSGTLRSVVGPIPYHPRAYTNNGGTAPTAQTYTTPHYGICHTLLEAGARDILLIHDADGIRVHEGWDRDWHTLIGPPGSGADVELEFAEQDGRAGFNTQFVTTPAGIVIVPQGERAYFYDGTTLAPLGFSEVPGAPTAFGPKSFVGEAYNGTSGDTADTIGGYYKTGRSMSEAMGTSRLGTIRNDTIDTIDTASGKKSNSLGGTRMEGGWTAKLQFVDKWGNLSALSPESAPAAVPKEDNLTKDRAKDFDESAQALRIQLAWGDLDKGPDHCVAKNLYRTKDLFNSGIPGHYWLAPASKSSALIGSTLPNPLSTMYPDNIGDERLVMKAKDYVPVPIFRLAALAFGRLWIANTLANPGVVMASETGFFGTFTSDYTLFPDANGAEVTGMLAVNQGLLIFTETSTFLVTQDDTGMGFKTATLSTTIGCVAPDTACVRASGDALWLGREGFYRWSGQGMPEPASFELRQTYIRNLTNERRRKAVAAVDPRMDEYRCWVPYLGKSENNLCLVYNGGGWTTRTDVEAAAVCVTKDHRQYMLALGTRNSVPNVFVLDHDGQGDQAWDGTRTSVVETSWLRNTRSQRYASIPRATLWLRESGDSQLTVQVMRDWRDYPRMQETGEEPYGYNDVDPPPFWDNIVLDGTTEDELRDQELANHFVQRRPFWTQIDINLPSVETFKLRIEGAGDWEFIALIFDEQDRHAGGAKIPEGF